MPHYELKDVNSSSPKPEQIAQLAEIAAYKKTTNSSAKTLVLAMSAGIFIGLAFVFYITVTTGAENMSWGLNHLMGGIAFSLGLIFLVVCGGELFTSSVLSIMARASGQLSTRKMLASWGKVYIGNFVGATLLVMIVFFAKLHILDHGLWGTNALNIGLHKLHHTFIQAVMLGILCNVLVCLAIWMSYSSTSSTGKSLLVILPVAMFVSTGFEHVVANMFMVPLSIAIKSWASPEFWQQAGINVAHYSDLTWSNFVFHNLIPVTIGNIIGGGVIVGLGYWSIYQRDNSESNRTTADSSANTYLFSKPIGENKMNTLKKLTVADVMQTPSHVVNSEMSLGQAADLLIKTQQSGSVVIDNSGIVQGFISEQDILRVLWLEDYQQAATTPVKTIMKKDVLTVTLNHNLLKLAEFMSVDLTQVYPVSDTGILLSGAQQTLEQRVHNSNLYRPRIFPVVDDGHLVGIVSRHDVLSALKSTIEAPSVMETNQEAPFVTNFVDVA